MITGAAAGLLILGTAPAFADPTATPSETPPETTTSSSVPPEPEAPKAQPGDTPVPASPKAAAAAVPDLVMEPLTKPAGKYVEGESFTISVTIANMGEGKAELVKAAISVQPGAKFEVTDWQGLDLAGSGTTLEPKEKRQLVFSVRVTEAIEATGRIEFAVSAKDETNTADNKQQIPVDVVPWTTKGALSGTLFLDKDNNDRWSAGEGVAGVDVTVDGPRVRGLKVKTDANGRFTAADLSAGEYKVTPPGLPDGWLVKPGSIVVRGATTDLQLRAVRPLTDTLTVTAKFNEGSYKPGAGANLTITLANGGSKDLSIVASCDFDPDPEGPGKTHLEGTDNSFFWGNLVPAQAGVPVKAGQTETVTVRGTVPVKAIERGVVHIHCAFGTKDNPFVDGFPQVFALAKVPGMDGVGNGHFFEDRDGDGQPATSEGIKGLVVSLLDPFDGKVVATTTTLDDGGYKFEKVPAGWYIPVLKGPWQLKYNEFLVIAADGWGDKRKLQVVPGPMPAPDPVPALPKHPPANNQDTTSNQTVALAKTGANVIGLTIGGVAVLLLGVGALVFTRKRRRS